APQMLAGSANAHAMASSDGLQQHLVRVDGSARGWGTNQEGPGENGTGADAPIPAPVLAVGGAMGSNLNLGNYDGRKSNFSGTNNDGWLFWRLPSVGANTLWRLQGNTVLTNQAITPVGTTWSVPAPPPPTAHRTAP